MGLLSLLFGCGDSNESAYHKKNGEWFFAKARVIADKAPANFKPINKTFAKDDHTGYYRETLVEGSDGASFQALNEYYAKDKTAVYFCDTQRDSKEYWSIKRNRIIRVKDADPATYQLIAGGGGYHARDKANAYYRGERFPVNDVASFEILEYGFDRDKIRAYYRLREIAGSDGASFTALDLHYAKDKSNVYFVRLTEFGGAIKGAHAESFQVLEEGYARDHQRAYHTGEVITRDAAATLEYLAYGYAKTQRQVFYRGKPMPNTDAASFAKAEPLNDNFDAADKSGRFKNGERVQ